ncbi:MAG: hypothetical protein ABH803_01040 [Candidatus Micrarchaeota archaeon]
MDRVGVVEHYFDKISVAVINLSAPLRTGDVIIIKNAVGDKVLEQSVSSMQIDMKSVSEAGKGDSIGLKISARVHEGNLVFKK